MNSHELNREGRRKLEAELLRRGAASVTSTSRGTRRTYLLATNSSHSRTVELRIKTKQKGSWHTTTDEAKPANASLDSEDAKKFWVFVDFACEPRYWIVPDWWIRNDIHNAHQQYLQKHGGHRARNDNTNHHSIEESRLGRWQDKWETLGIF
jgi:hypothetical protein